MRSLTLIAASLALVMQLSAQEGRDQTRPQLFSYSSAAMALEGSTATTDYVQNLSGEWQYKNIADSSLIAEAIASESGWTAIRMPQEISIASPVTIYRTYYKFPFAWIDREILVRIGGANSPYDIYINGGRTATNSSGRVAAEFNVTKLTREDYNMLDVVVFGNSPLKAIENHSPAGETRLVGESFVLSQPRIRVRDIIADTRFNDSNGLLDLGLILKSHLLNPREVMVYYELYDPDGELVERGRKESKFEMRLEDRVSFPITVPKVRPWSHETPYLYTLAVRVQRDGRYLEHLSFRIGFRSYEMRNGDFIVNGVPTGLTVAEYLPAEDAERAAVELSGLKSQGYNTIKLKHYPQSDRIYSLCDALGLYLIVQADIDTHLGGGSLAAGGNPSNDPLLESYFTDRIGTLYASAKGHPSVIGFSIAENSANGYNLYESYLALKRMEGDRLIIYLQSGDEFNSDASADGLFERVKLDSLPHITALREPVIELKDRAGGLFEVTNFHTYTPIVSFVYRILNGRTVVGEGTLESYIAPGETGQISVPMNVVRRMTDRISVELAWIAPERTFMAAVETGASSDGRLIDRALNLIRR